ncbi:MLX-interacting protein-like isoform X2 [Apostichopus japonicus]|uniref:MLX-interacting protein-like isoform X2 n=1 Tax=Stichopus japonicus TaxID=307972 RepID=UPI003AB62A34
MTKRDGEISVRTAHYDRTGAVSKRSPTRNELLECGSSPSKQNHIHQRYSQTQTSANDGSFNMYRDSRSAPNSVPGSASGSRANSRPGSRLQSRCNSQESIIDLFDSMSLKYGQNLDGSGTLEFKTPKPKRLANTKMSYIERVRINSAVWRSWHIQYVKKQTSAVCQFSSPLPETSTRLVSDVIQGKTALTGYKPEELGAVVRNYNKWRTFSRDILTHRPMLLASEGEENAIDLDSPHPPLSPGTGGKLVNDDLFKDFADTLFISTKTNRFRPPAPKKVTQEINYNPDYLQPDLSTLMYEVDDEFMEAVTSVEAMLSKTPTKCDPRQLGLMDSVPDSYFSENLSSLLTDMEPQVIQAGGRPALSHFNNEQTTPPPHKSVSFSAPTTPRQQSAASSPGYGIPIDYEFPATLQGYDHNGSNRVQTAKKTMPYRQTQQRNSAYMNPAFLRNDPNQPMGVGGNHVVQQHPTIMETLQNAPILPNTQTNTISTVNHSVTSECLSPVSSTPSPSGHVTPETKMEPVSPSHPGSLGGSSTAIFTPASSSEISVGNFTYQIGETSPVQLPQFNEVPWPPSTTINSNQLSLLGIEGGQTFTLQGNQLIAHGPIYTSSQDQEMMDYGQFQTLPPQTSSQEVFKQPTIDVSISSGMKSPKGNKRSSSQLESANIYEAFNRKKSTGGLDQTMQREEQDRQAKSIPSSCQASNASSAASSPGNDSDFTAYYSNHKKRTNADVSGQDDKHTRRKRKHLDSEHKRRYNIQSCLEELQKVVPSMNNGSSREQPSKYSTAILLQKAHEHICSMKGQVEALKNEEKEIKQQITELSDEIEQCQDALPDTGAPVNSQNDAQISQMVDEYLETEMVKNWKFWIFSKFARPLFKSYLNAIKLSSGSSIGGDLTSWVEESCRLRHLRKLALIPVRQISKETSILTDPSKLPEQVQGIIQRERNPSAPSPDV